MLVLSGCELKECKKEFVGTIIDFDMGECETKYTNCYVKVELENGQKILINFYGNEIETGRLVYKIEGWCNYNNYQKHYITD